MVSVLSVQPPSLNKTSQNATGVHKFASKGYVSVTVCNSAGVYCKAACYGVMQFPFLMRNSVIITFFQ